ncbi:MAG: phosphoribosylglycinamide formyltransferase [Clostridiaceae bacterium]|nr:phosphoribosylglycinamide formyltransferase [Clostridiaceae bacterium]
MSPSAAKSPLSPPAPPTSPADSTSPASPATPTRLAIFASGSGTNFVNLVAATRDGRLFGCEVVVLFSDQPTARCLERAAELGIPAFTLERAGYPNRRTFETAIISRLSSYAPDLIALAGYMRILGSTLLTAYPGRIVNIHPALLPAFPGAHAIQDAYLARVPETGVTVHFVDAGIDSGPIILQQSLAVDPDWTLEELTANVHAVEYQLYPAALSKVINGESL